MQYYSKIHFFFQAIHYVTGFFGEKYLTITYKFKSKKQRMQ